MEEHAVMKGRPTYFEYTKSRWLSKGRQQARVRPITCLELAPSPEYEARDASNKLRVFIQQVKCYSDRCRSFVSVANLLVTTAKRTSCCSARKAAPCELNFVFPTPFLPQLTYLFMLFILPQLCTANSITQLKKIQNWSIGPLWQNSSNWLKIRLTIFVS